MSSNWIKKSTRQTIYSRDEMICCYCGKQCKHASIKGMTRSEQIVHMKANQADIATLDHIVPRSILSAEQLSNPENLVTVCNQCNSSKKSVSLREWCFIKALDYALIVARINTRISLG